MEMDPLRDANLRTVEAFFDPAQQSRRLELFAEDGVKEIPFAPRMIEPRAWRGRAELERNAAENAGRFAGIAHVDVRIFPSADPNELWATSHMGPEATLHGRPYPQEFVHYFRLENGRIKIWREYFNSSVRESEPPNRGGVLRPGAAIAPARALRRAWGRTRRSTGAHTRRSSCTTSCSRTPVSSSGASTSTRRSWVRL